ncbi:AraC family transcriptional regulator [Faecalibacter bovis]|uniref:AraC family transcriptional regulator n=1 Tax=Faecalibacter bovis TaxID=2898187 RepID=A0ABX7XC01_9FLAO|nr:AraC family transcriptional regulator [Faecalibacter bovis]
MKILLRKKECYISEISYILGFNDVSHFLKFFKLKTGISPKIFRKNSLIIQFILPQFL